MRQRWVRMSVGTLGTALLTSAGALAQGPAAATEPVSTAERPPGTGHRVLFAVNDDYLFGIGGELQIRRSPWAVHGRISPLSATPLLALGVRRTLLTTKRTETNIVAATGALSCASFLDGPCPVEPRAQETYRLAIGAAAQWLTFGLAGSERWAAGLEIGYWRRFARSPDPGFDRWTFGVVIHRRFGDPR